MDFNARITKHASDYRNNLASSALVKHVQEFPGHAFNPWNARLIWTTRDVYQSQLLEAACIKLFPSCNRGPGDVTVSQTFASVCMHLAGFKGNADFSSPMTNSSVSSVTTAPMYMSQGVPAGAQDINDVVSGTGLVTSVASSIDSRQVELHIQHLNVSSSMSHITASQPQPRRLASIMHDEEIPSSQLAGNNPTLNSPRRTRSRGLCNTYRLSYRRQGFELS